ncbi:MAG: ferritin family protein [Christensenellales bacterium]|jgi:rubrerythrin
MYYDPGYSRYAFYNQPGRYMQTEPMQQYIQQDQYSPGSNLSQALRLIEDALRGETEDRLFYQFLISQATEAKDKDIIAGIRDDEMKHFEMFRQLYSDLTQSNIPSVQQIPFEQPASYCAGLRKALMGEQNAVTKYRKILFAMRDRKHINMMTEIITDELRHLGLYNYLYARNGCKD